jgi:hypothetical protein
MAETICELSRQQRYEEAGAARDEAERLRTLIERHRRTESLRVAGRVVLDLDGEGEVVLDGGLLVGAGPSTEPLECGGTGVDQVVRVDHVDQERAIVAQWLGAHAEKVRILEVESSAGIAVPAIRIPALSELTGRCTAPAGHGRPTISAGGLLGRGLLGHPDQGLQHVGGPAVVDDLAGLGDATG